MRSLESGRSKMSMRSLKSGGSKMDMRLGLVAGSYVVVACDLR